MSLKLHQPVKELIKGTHWPENIFLNWQDILTIKDVFSFGSHTTTHARLDLLSSDRLYSELEQSKRYIKDKTGQEIIALSWPHGAYNKKAIENPTILFLYQNG